MTRMVAGPSAGSPEPVSLARFGAEQGPSAPSVAGIVVWVVTGPTFGSSDTWQLVINTGTTIVTFLMVFLIQSTQNRDTEAFQVKLDEMSRATEGAHNEVVPAANA